MPFSLNYRYRRIIKIVNLFMSDGIQEKAEANAGAHWVDDWFTVEEIDQNTFIISEPRYFLKNNSYLIIGDSAAVLFDTGSGKRDISPIVHSLTELPLMVLPSHSHSDHLGNISRFQNIALADLPINRKCSRNNIFTPSFIMYCDFSKPPKIPVSNWLSINEEIDLGNRSLKIAPIPGHSSDSIALVDEQNRMLFTGDFLYEGNMIATLGASVVDYLSSIQTLLALTKGNETFYPAHYKPRLEKQHLLDLEQAIIKIVKGDIKGRRYIFSRNYHVSDHVGFITTTRNIKAAARASKREY